MPSAFVKVAFELETACGARTFNVQVYHIPYRTRPLSRMFKVRKYNPIKCQTGLCYRLECARDTRLQTKHKPTLVAQKHAEVCTSLRVADSYDVTVNEQITKHTKQKEFMGRIMLRRRHMNKHRSADL